MAKKINMQSTPSTLMGSSSDQYNSILQQVQGSRFEDVLKANPYNSTSRTQTFWDRLLNSLGFRSGYDKAIDQMNLSSAEYNAQVAQLASEEEYNNESSQVARLQAVGINPDLNGISPGQASEFDNAPNTPDINAQSVSIQDVAGLAMNVYSLTTGFLKTSSELKMLENSVLKGDIENVQGMINAGLDIARFTGDPSDPDNERNIDDRWSSVSKYFRSSRSRRLFGDSLSMAFGSLPATEQEYNSRFNISQKRTDYNRTRSSQYFSEFDDIQKALFEPIVRFAEDNAKRQLEIDRKLQNVQSASADYDLSRTQNLDPSASAEAENAQNRQVSQSADMQTELRSVMSKIVHNLASASDRGNRWASIALVILQGMFSLSGSVNSGSTSVGPKGVTTNSGSFGIGF